MGASTSKAVEEKKDSPPRLDMYKVNIVEWSVAEIEKKMPLLLESAAYGKCDEDIRKRRKDLLDMLAEKQATLTQPLDTVTRILPEVQKTLDGLSPYYRKFWHEVAEHLQNKRDTCVNAKKRLQKGIKIIEEQMKTVGLLLVPYGMEPSKNIFDEAADMGPEEGMPPGPMSIN
jgi:hypothetical protein